MTESIIIISAGQEQIRAYELANDLGIFVIGTDMNENAPAFKFADMKLICSTRDIDQTLESVKIIPSSLTVKGVMTIGNDDAPTVSAVAEYFETPSISSKAAKNASDKSLMKSCFEKAGIPSPKYRLVDSKNQFFQLVSSMGFPLVLKPSDGRGSEATPFAVITHAKSQKKKGIGSSHLYPVLSILDPVLLTTMPAHQTAVTGFDAFAQAIEGFTSVNSTIHSEIYGIQALQLIIENFEKCYDAPKNLEARTKMAWGASMAGLSIGLVDVNLAHAMSHPLSGHFNIQHGLAVALCTVPAIRFNQEHVGNKYRQVAKLFGKDANSNHEAANIVIKKYRRLAEKFGISLKLKNYNIPEEKLVSVVTDTLEIGAIRTNPRPVMHSDLEHLFTAVWEGHDA